MRSVRRWLQSISEGLALCLAGWFSLWRRRFEKETEAPAGRDSRACGALNSLGFCRARGEDSVVFRDLLSAFVSLCEV